MKRFFDKLSNQPFLRYQWVGYITQGCYCRQGCIFQTLIMLILFAAPSAFAQHVGIGTTNPQASLHIKGSGFPESFIYLQSNAGQDAGIRLYEGDVPKWHIFNQSITGGLHIYNNALQTALFASQSSGFVGIGTTNPTARLDVNGQLKISGGTPGAGKVLTSDAAGLASWVSLPPLVLSLPYVGFANTNVAFAIINEKAIAIEGKVTAADGAGTGIFGETASSGGRGVRGLATSTTGTTYGVFGESAADNGFGLKGLATSPTGSTFGCWATSASSSGYGIIGDNTSLTGTTFGVYGTVTSPDGYSGYFTGGKFYAEGPMGVGTTAPSRQLTVKTATGISSANFVNNASGATSTDGLMIGLTGTLTASIINYENAYLAIGTNNTPQITIQPNGDVGIGTMVPIYKMDVAGEINLNKSIASGIAMRVNGDEAIWYNNTYFSWGYAADYNFFGNKLRIGGNGNLAPAYTLYVDGTAAKSSAGTAWVVSSDARLKHIRGNYNKGLKEIMGLQPVEFTYLPENPRQLNTIDPQIGFVAQEVQKLFPEAVSVANDGYLDFDIHAVNVAVINALKELKTENDRLKARLEDLERKVGTRKD